MMPADQFHALQLLIDRIFTEADGQDLGNPGLAAAAGLSYSTVRNLDAYKTRYPRAQTVLMLAAAVGLESQFTAPRRRTATPRPRLRVIG